MHRMVGASGRRASVTLTVTVSGGVSFEGESYLITLPFIASQTRLNTFRVLFIIYQDIHGPCIEPSSTLSTEHPSSTLQPPQSPHIDIRSFRG